MIHKLQIQLPPNGPNVIGATGGSGTRVVLRIVRLAGMYVGTKFNKANDARSFKGYYKPWSIKVFQYRNSGLPTELQIQMIRELQSVLEDHLAGFNPEDKLPWGWKNPMSMYVLPLFHTMLPHMKFIHLIRDGRDMAYSRNQNQLRKLGRLFLSSAERETWSQPVQSMALWNRANLLVAEYGEKKMPGQYLRIRFEDLCLTPVATIGQILEFFGLQGDAEQIAGEEVSPPDSIGRWHHQDRATLKRLHQVGGVGLEKFGYAIPEKFRFKERVTRATEDCRRFDFADSCVPSTSELQDIQANLQKSRQRLAQIQIFLENS